ncbi:MAG: 6-pyruvoyl-tetrahydropterin synthase-related protein [Blastocatellia bacterium]
MPDAVSSDSPVASPALSHSRKTTLRDHFNRTNLIAAIVICAGATLIFLPIIIRGFPNGEDAYVHYRWAAEFKAALGEGVSLYPRWLGLVNNGAGSPTMLYYPPLPFFVTAAFDFLIGDTLRALSLSCWLATALAGLAMVIFSRRLVSPRWALVAAVLYMAAPYAAFDLYQRSALSEYWTFAWLPLILDATCHVIAQKNWRALIYLSASYAALLLTHLPLAFALTMLLPVFALALTRQLRALARVAAGFLLGAALSAVYLLPVLVERGYVRADRTLRIRYVNYFLFEHLGSALRAPLFPGVDERRFVVVEGTTLVALSLPVLLALSLIVIFILRRSAPSVAAKRQLIAISIIAVLSLLMTTRLSSFVWKVVPQLAYLQFPFRWLVIATATTFLLMIVALAALFPLNKTGAALVIAFVVAMGFGLRMSLLAMTRASYDRTQLEAGLSEIEVPEYRPVWWSKQKHIDTSKPDEFASSPVLVRQGNASVDVIDAEGMRQSYAITAMSEATLNLRTLYFPGWAASVDGQPISIEPSDEGNIQLTVGPGAHYLTLAFEDTPPRRAGKLVSGIALTLLIGIWITETLRQRRGARASASIA